MTMSCRNSLPSQLRRLSTTVSKKGVTIDNDPAVLLLRDFAHGPRMFSCLCPGWVRHPWRQRCNRMSSRQQEPVAGGERGKRSPVGSTSAACFQSIITSTDPLPGYFHENVAPVGM
jgi:hypothetical protein